MKLLIKSVRICDQNSSFHKKKVDVLVENGKISKIGSGLKGGSRSIEGNGMWLTPGWMDAWASFGDPGYEHKEDLNSGKEAAARGGFTAVAVLPNTNPIVQTKNEVKYILGRNGGHVTDLYPIAAVTKSMDGETLTEMMDLERNGAVAFSDGEPLEKGETVVKALRYLQNFGGLLIQRAEDSSLSSGGQMHEGEVSTYLGLRGIPNVAEAITIQRDLDLLKYAGGRLHFANVSTPEGVDLIRKAKKSGLAVTCSVASYQVSYTDQDLEDFDTNLKVLPPLRTQKEINALLKGLADGTIDIINSNHMPQDEESKKLEFDRADPGMISLQTLASDLVKMSAKVPYQDLLPKVSTTPRDLLGFEKVVIEEGEIANITLFDPKRKWTFSDSENASKSDNSRYIGEELVGKAVLVVNDRHNYIDDGL